MNPGVMQQSNLLQTLTQQRNPQQPGIGGGGILPNRQNQMQPNQMQPMQNQMNPQMNPGGNMLGNMNQMGPVGGMPGMNNQGMVPMGMNPINNAAQMNQGMPNVNQNTLNPAGNVLNSNQMIGMSHPVRKPGDMMMNSPGNVFQGGVRSVTPNQFLRQSPSPSVPSPAGGGQMSHQNQMIPSPSMAQLPSPQMPGMMNVQQRSMQNVMAPSPGSSLNTPGQAMIPSPLNPQEDQLYREKYRQLTKYIEPLKRMVARMMNEKNRELNVMCLSGYVDKDKILKFGIGLFNIGWMQIICLVKIMSQRFFVLLKFSSS